MDVCPKVSGAVITLEGKERKDDDESDEESKDHIQGKGGKS
jgi:hypothetical protein